MPTFEQIIYEVAEPGIVRVVLDRDEARNAQDTRMLYELNDALDLAAQDDELEPRLVRVALPRAGGADGGVERELLLAVGPVVIIGPNVA